MWTDVLINIGVAAVCLGIGLAIGVSIGRASVGAADECAEGDHVDG